MKPEIYLTYVIRWMWWHKQLVSEPRVDTDQPAKMTFRTFERRGNKAEWEKKKLYQAQKKDTALQATPTPNISRVLIK
jgi:hypothetical protein